VTQYVGQTTTQRLILASGRSVLIHHLTARAFVELVVQVHGKVRATLVQPRGFTEDEERASAWVTTICAAIWMGVTCDGSCSCRTG